MKKRVIKVVGTISDKIVEKYLLHDYHGKRIVQSLDLYIHISKHILEFKSVDSYINTISSIPDILLNPYFVYFDKDRKSLLYFKKINQSICVVVKLVLRKNKDCYVATIYPISDIKVKRYMEWSNKN